MKILEKFLSKRFFQGKASAYILFLLIIIIFAWRGAVVLDPDFGWHMKSGEYIVQYGFPQTDPFSYTMPSFPYIDHAWGSSVLFFLLYPQIGSIGLSVLLLAFLLTSVVLASVIALRTKKTEFKNIIPEVVYSPVFVISIAVFSYFFIIRAQVFSWFFWSVFLYIFLQKTVWNKWKYFLPLLFIGWVNIHGGFAIGIFALGAYAIVHVLKRDLSFSDASVVLLSLLSTFANPYGVNIWREVFMTVSSPLLRMNIGEWRSIVFTLDIPLFCFLTLSAIFVWKYWRKFEAEHLFLYIFLFSQSILSLKNVPFFFLLAIPLTMKTFIFLHDQIYMIPHGKKRFAMVFEILWNLFFIIFLVELFFSMKAGYELKEENYYPGLAIAYLREHKPEGRIFSDYGWGGYLDWKYPEEKVFSDGRMAIWRWQNAPDGELANAFEDYVRIGKGEEPYTEVFDTFDITIVLWPTEKEQKPVDRKIEEWDTYFRKLFGKEERFDFIKTLEKDGWEKVYEDDVAVIYEKPKG